MTPAPVGFELVPIPSPVMSAVDASRGIPAPASMNVTFATTVATIGAKDSHSTTVPKGEVWEWIAWGGYNQTAPASIFTEAIVQVLSGGGNSVAVAHDTSPAPTTGGVAFNGGMLAQPMWCMPGDKLRVDVWHSQAVTAEQTYGTFAYRRYAIRPRL